MVSESRADGPRLVPTPAQDMCGVYGALTERLRARGSHLTLADRGRALCHAIHARRHRVARSVLAAEPARARWKLRNVNFPRSYGSRWWRCSLSRRRLSVRDA